MRDTKQEEKKTIFDSLIFTNFCFCFCFSCFCFFCLCCFFCTFSRKMSSHLIKTTYKQDQIILYKYMRVCPPKTSHPSFLPPSLPPFLPSSLPLRRFIRTTPPVQTPKKTIEICRRHTGPHCLSNHVQRHILCLRLQQRLHTHLCHVLPWD